MKQAAHISPDTPLEKLFALKPEQLRALKRLRLVTARDLLLYFPSRYAETSAAGPIATLETGTGTTIYGRVISTKISRGWKTKIPMGEAVIEDGSGKIKAVWFHQPYIVKTLATGTSVKLSGKVSERKGARYLANPHLEPLAEIPTESTLVFGGEQKETILPIYPETQGVSSLWIRHHVETLIKKGVHSIIPDPIPSEILARYHLPTLGNALIFIHAPQKPGDALAARKRFAFEEVFVIQLARMRDRAVYNSRSAFVVDTPQKEIDSFIQQFPFALTGAQERATRAILDDMRKEVPMARLLEGDVGSGKTAVAAIASLAVISSPPPENRFARLQVAYMAPTEILARQHFESFVDLFRGSNISIGLITGSGCRKFPSKVNPDGTAPLSRAQFLRYVKDGELSIVIGTHALIADRVLFRHLALVIIDEQHRFGTMQRARIVKKGERVPHLLSMTATPIPRTLALTIYGDLDLTLLDELPPGRPPIQTSIVAPHDRSSIYLHIKRRLSEGRQAYIICPRIDEPDPTKFLALNAKSVTEEARRLKKDIFPEYVIGILHGKMTPKEKEDVMRSFSEGDIHILVATSVVEVGVNVPNATVMVIEGAERFGLSQLHQLRGRVARSTHIPECFLFTETKSEATMKRLRALGQAKNGFELAEKDLLLRGAGELSGGKQWGISDIGMEAIRNIKMVEAAREEARAIIARDPDITSLPSLADRVAHSQKTTHFE